MDLISTPTKQLDAVAVDLKRSPGDTDRTRLVHDAIERIAAEHAATMRIGYGTQCEVACPGRRTLYVHRADSKSASALGQFVFDQCWIIKHCTGERDNTDAFAETGEPRNHYPIRCELAVESEWVRQDGRRVHMYDDFLKLVVGKAKLKLFLFNCRERDAEDIVLRLRSYLLSFEQRAEDEIYLVSCFRDDVGQFDHRVLRGDGSEHSLA
jgi:hypothetical protein